MGGNRVNPLSTGRPRPPLLHIYNRGLLALLDSLLIRGLLLLAPIGTNKKIKIQKGRQTPATTT